MRFVWAVPPIVILLLLFNYVNNVVALLQPQAGAAFSWVAYYGFGLAVLYANPRLFFLYLDLLTLSMLTAVFVISWRSVNMNRAFQLCSLLVIVLVIMVSLVAPQDLFTYVAFSQYLYNFAPWFTNADMLGAASFILAFGFFYPRLKQRFRERSEHELMGRQ